MFTVSSSQFREINHLLILKKLQFYQQHGVEIKLQKQIDFDRDERKAQQVIQGVRNYLAEFSHLITSFEDELNNQI